MDTAASEAVYQFEELVLDLVRGALLDAKGVEVPLRAKSFDLLCLFVTNASRLLDREAINQAIWSDVVVTDDAITQCVRDIRRAIGDVHRRILKTVARRGYIFAATVTRGGQQPLAVPVAEPLPLPDKAIDCRAAVRQPERRSRAGIFFRWVGSRHHHGTVA